MRGDVPPPLKNPGSGPGFSPRARGCSLCAINRVMIPPVFPACAGMFPARGARTTAGLPFSPRARGCSATTGSSNTRIQVFPACAGMFPAGQFGGAIRVGFPRVRGDVPSLDQHKTLNFKFSPRARGCSFDFVPVDHHAVVFPACAGMFRIHTTHAHVNKCFPRVRGDVPKERIMSWVITMFSPRARGCS